VPDLSICIPCKNRSRCAVRPEDYSCEEIDNGHKELRTIYPLPNCIRSIALSAMPGDDWEIVIADFGSDDWPLSEWVALMATPVPVRIVQVDEPFSAGKGLNVAAANARADNLLFLATDMLVNRAVMVEGMKRLREGLLYIPQPTIYKDPDHTKLVPGSELSGTDFICKAMFAEVGPFPEFRSNGLGDSAWFERATIVLGPQRFLLEAHAGLFHQWHPHRPEWKNRHYPHWQEDEAKKHAAWKAGQFQEGHMEWPAQTEEAR